ncbi:hypothetical protein C8P68_102774 [Mucilaginibacter yixingensis]|uniref:Uncharacterized protein n=1 Tax=Mucilaginibacter yixingensis TaxID=1295612 RepID=A0A2T5JDW3_9SPHI|nr:hypothetical protein [Mucilaginibacter yixingensis]PTQ99943.1 hypothetical protein C8P68_102774 [Mucilaginibacter yixingensis]
MEKILPVFLPLLILPIFSIGQQKPIKYDPFKKYKVENFINVDAIDSIEVYNTWTNKKWMVKNKNLDYLKYIIKKSTGIASVIVKPGHLYLRFFSKQKLDHYDTYAYTDCIVFDCLYDKKTLEPYKDTPLFTISFSNKIDWDKLK